MPAATLTQHKSSSLVWDTEGRYIEASPADAYGDVTGGSCLERGLLPLFAPRTVAVIGATERQGAVGGTVVWNLIRGQEQCCVEAGCGSSSSAAPFAIYPVNPTRDTVYGLPCYPDITRCPEKVDLAVIVTPAKTVTAVMESCGAAKVSVVIVISAGFKEIGEAGAKLEADLQATANRHGIRIVGPNCLGVMSPHSGLNATFAATAALPGSIAFLSQSGAMCTAVLDWSLKYKVGFSAFVSIGSMADVSWGDLIDYLGHDHKTQSILMYMETVGNAEHFLSAARAIAMYKPIVVIKAGRTAAAAKAAASHTGSLAGSHEAFVAAMQRAGVMVVDSIAELCDVALVLGKQPRPRGDRLLIVTNAGGPGVLATDATALSGASVAPLADSTIVALDKILPPAWSHANPVDVLGDASASLYAQAMEVALADENVDGVLVVLSPQSVTDCTGTAQKVVEAYHKIKGGTALKDDHLSASNAAITNGVETVARTVVEGATTVASKPILCSWMGGEQVSEGMALLNSSGIPCFAYPDSAARAFGKIWCHTSQLMAMCDPAKSDNRPEDLKREQLLLLSSAKKTALSVVAEAASQARELLTEDESKQVLAAYGIPVAGGVICSSEDSAVAEAEATGYPCVMKLHSMTITHKSDVGGVKLNLRSASDVSDAWGAIRGSVGQEHFQGVSMQPMLDLSAGIELIMGSVVDDQMGPLILFGAGGCFVEIFKDTALALPPLTPALALLQVNSTKVATALRGGHGQRFPGIDVASLSRCLQRFSRMVCDLTEVVAECDVNPLLALPGGRLVALDARIVLRGRNNTQAPLAIRPYPSQYIFSLSETLTVRPLQFADASCLETFHRGLAQEAVEDGYLRLAPLAERICTQRLVSVADADYARTLALGAFVPADDSTTLVGLARLTRWPTRLTRVDLKLLIARESQVVAAALLRSIIEIARRESTMETIEWHIRGDNLVFINLAKDAGFEVPPPSGGPDVRRCILRVGAAPSD